MKNRLDQHKGPLSCAQIAAGINAAIKNASRLASDAREMLQRERLPSATSLSILSIEESGKARILRELALARNQDELNSAWRQYRQHTSKNQLWLVLESVAKGASKLQDFAHLFNPDSDHPHLLDQLKQISIYTDCLGNGNWSIPEAVIEPELTGFLVGTAEILSKTRTVTPEEIDLWIFYMQPVYRTTLEAMQSALVAWDEEMRKRGLQNENRISMEEFIKKGFRNDFKRTASARD